MTGCGDCGEFPVDTDHQCPSTTGSYRDAIQSLVGLAKDVGDRDRKIADLLNQVAELQADNERLRADWTGAFVDWAEEVVEVIDFGGLPVPVRVQQLIESAFRVKGLENDLRSSQEELKRQSKALTQAVSKKLALQHENARLRAGEVKA